MSEIRPLRAYAEIALGRQRSPQHESGPFMTRYLRAANVKDGRLDLADVKEMNFEPSEQRSFSLAPGDVLVTEGSGSIGAVGASAVWNSDLPGTVCFQNTLLRLRPRSSTDPRFLGWWCRSAFADGQFASIATGANIFHLSADRVRSMPLVYAPLAEQRAIADFLDTETARIDALIAKKRRLAGLIDEHARASVHELQASDTVVPLRRLASLLPGYSFSSDSFGSDYAGPRLLRGINVGVGEVRWDDAVYLAGDDATVERYRLQVGDVVVGMDRPFIGGGTRVAVVGRSDAGGFLVQRVCRVRPTSFDQATVIEAAVGSSRFVAHVEPDLTGVSVPHLSEEQIGSFPIPALSDGETRRRAERLRSIASQSARARRALNRQIDLLVEHRQALITAAVTGELKIPGVAA